jgi:HEAT repeats
MESTPAVAPVAPVPPVPPAMAEPFDYDLAPMPFDLHMQFDLEDKLSGLNEKLADLEWLAPKIAGDFKLKGAMDRMNFDLKGLSAPMAFAQSMAGSGSNLMRVRNGSDDRLYQSGQSALENRHWDEALEDFGQAASRGGSRADGALYWKAYTLNKLGRREEALAALAELGKSYAGSRWLDDAKALELEVKQAGGQPVSPDQATDEDLKLLALNGLVQSDPDRAFPLLENLLKGTQSPKLKKNVVYVLAQSNSPRAQQLLEQIARGAGNPDLQLRAISYMGEKRKANGAQVLSEIYAASNDVNVRRAILNSFANNRDKDHLLQVAKQDKSPELRLLAIQHLGSFNGQPELWQIYQTETSPELKIQILQSMYQNGNTDKLIEVAKTEKDANVRRMALQVLGSHKAANISDALVSIYNAESDPQIKRSIVDSVYSQRNAKALVDMARAEKDSKMKLTIVERLSNMKSKEASDYLAEILK